MAGVELVGSRVLLTGASSGIGRELARELAVRGASLALSARRTDLLETLADELEGGGHRRPLLFEGDLSERGAAETLAAAAEEGLGGVDVLINNAGSGVGGYIATLGDREEARQAFETNYWSPLALIHALVPSMTERGSGAVVNVTSLAQVTTWPTFGGYAATKAALAVATETLAMEAKGTGIHVTEVIPGPVDTAIQGETRLAPGIDKMLGRVPLGDAGELAGLIAVALERGTARVIYPRRARLAYMLPGLVRSDLRRLAARSFSRLDPAVHESLRAMVVRSGSGGDPAVQEARRAWEQERGRA